MNINILSQSSNKNLPSVNLNIPLRKESTNIESKLIQFQTVEEKSSQVSLEKLDFRQSCNQEHFKSPNLSEMKKSSMNTKNNLNYYSQMIDKGKDPSKKQTGENFLFDFSGFENENIYKNRNNLSYLFTEEDSVTVQPKFRVLNLFEHKKKYNSLSSRRVGLPESVAEKECSKFKSNGVFLEIHDMHLIQVDLVEQLIKFSESY